MFCHTGLGHDRETHLFYDDTCIVPERLEGKTGLRKFELLKAELRKFVDNLEFGEFGLPNLIMTDVHIVSCVLL